MLVRGTKFKCIALMGFIFLSSNSYSCADEAVILIDAEFGIPTSTSAQAIELGAKIAAREINGSGILGDRKLTIRTSNNRGISAVAVDNFIDAAKDASVIAVMGGKFSPVQQEVVPLTRDHSLMLLNPWGSADGIVDNGINPNWVFRASLKDEWASSAFLLEAKRRGFSKVGLILPNTSWGRSGQAAINKQAMSMSVTITGERWYNWGDRSLVQRYLDLIEGGAEIIILVANELEGSVLVKEVASLEEGRRRPILSHWGITGGEFEQMTAGALHLVDLTVIQTFSFHRIRTARAKELLNSVFNETGVAEIHKIKSPVGIAQAYDLTWFLALAMQRVRINDRNALRKEMEKLPSFSGAVKNYERPFTEVNHEALSINEVFFARYAKEGGLLPTD